ncbi:hypothetical protein DICVIV_09351 [Dictyocaulus viviparus]|uniref:Uncharacterized protein n=1 Tax=Dictyocaulus viviparus TaxID=29172 RepID=A0A0D8XJ22_DICVI|nr:hypothetical protein DICVIV_09351 [Dictyocaulus viviparus]
MLTLGKLVCIDVIYYTWPEHGACQVIVRFKLMRHIKSSCSSELLLKSQVHDTSNGGIQPIC